MQTFIILSLILTIASAQVPVACDANTPCTDPQTCNGGFCEDPQGPMGQIEPVVTACNAFENCKEYYDGCNKCEYDSEDNTVECEIDEDCDPNNPPPSQCKECMRLYDLAPQSTCCVVSTSVMKTAIDANIMTLFAQIDTDKSGFIERAEFDRFILADATLTADTLTAEQADLFFTDVDTNKDGKLSQEEMLNAHLRTDAQGSEDSPENQVETPAIETPAIETPSVDSNENEVVTAEIETPAIEGPEIASPSVDSNENAPAMVNDGDNIPDMFGIKDATPAETYSILTVIIIAGIVILCVLTWGIYQYAQKRKAVKELNEMEENQNKMNDIDKKPLYETEIIVTETRD